MSWTLAITGKGGVGKTTFAALAVRWLGEQGKGPVLAVDADPNACLDEVLGVQVRCSVGSVREEAKAIAQDGSFGGMSKHELLDLKIQESLVETDRFDLISMGRCEGPGCYCYANNVLRGVIGKLADQYPAVVIDNEAGLENLSRRTVQQPDWLVFVSDPSARGLKTARRLYELALEMQVAAKRFGVIVNRTRDNDSVRRVSEIFEGTEVCVLGAIPENDELSRQDVNGEPIFGLASENPVHKASQRILASMIERNTNGGR